MMMILVAPLYLRCTSLYWLYDGTNQILYVVDSESLLGKEVDSIVEEHDYLLLLDHVNNLDDDPCCIDAEEDLCCCCQLHDDKVDEDDDLGILDDVAAHVDLEDA